MKWEKKVEKKRKKREWNKKLKSKINKKRERKRECACACKWNIRKANRYFTTFPIAVNVVFTLFDFFFFIITNMKIDLWSTKNKIGKIKKDKIALDNCDCTKRLRLVKIVVPFMFDETEK